MPACRSGDCDVTGSGTGATTCGAVGALPAFVGTVKASRGSGITGGGTIPLADKVC